MLNESEIGKLVKDYGEGIPGFVPPARRRRAVLSFALSASAVVAAAVAGVVLLSPRAEAHGYAQMIRALRGAKTMSAVAYTKGVDGKYHLGWREWLDGDRWAFERFIPRPKLHKIYLITPQGYSVNYLDAGVTTREPSGWDFTLGKKTIVDWVIAENDIGLADAPQRMSELPYVPLIDGHKVRELRFDKQEQDMPGYRTIETVWIDSTTNLPVRCQVQDKEPDHRWSESITDYQFDVPIDGKMFAPRFEPVVDIAADEARLSNEWNQHPAAASPLSDVLDAQEAPDGSLYLLYEGDWTPTEVSGADGQAYVRAWDFHPGGFQGDSMAQKFSVGGREVKGVIFVPATLHETRTSAFAVKLQRAPKNWDQKSPLAGPQDHLAVRARDCGDWPDYTYDLVLSELFLQADAGRARAQAKALEDAGNIDDALRMYRTAYRDRQSSFSTIAYRELVPAERMLRKAGRVLEADQLRAQIDTERALDPNVEPAAKPVP